MLARKQGKMPRLAQLLTILHLDLADCVATESFNLSSMSVFLINGKPNLDVLSDSASALKAEILCIHAVFFLLPHIRRHNVKFSTFSETKHIQWIYVVSVCYKIPHQYFS